MLMALPPVFILLIGYFVFKEKIGWQAILVTNLAIMRWLFYSLYNRGGNSVA